MSIWAHLDWRPKGNLLALILIGWVICLHLSGLYLFTRGFLLSRLALPNVNSCPDDVCTSLTTHKRLVFLVIDALRYDFISPVTPESASPYHHNVLTLPKELTARHPSHSFIFNAFSDPPTSTMQRIKGITTGSLPTFIDIAANFDASAIQEDSLIKQFNSLGKKAAFMGDDTWMTVFPTLFSENMTFPYDSFNVEDLHSVDEGVIRHLFPLIEQQPDSWDVIVGHFLGVDHVGHRVGPDHPVMITKLKQMNNVLQRVVDGIDEDTLLVVLGDHGMDEKGDHGGDSLLETASAMWIYSKGPPLSRLPMSSFPPNLAPNTTFPGIPGSHRRIQQIDLVPTLSLLLGIPIPFNNLGTVIPELFSKSYETLETAMRINTAQIKGYLDVYRNSSHGAELDDVWSTINYAWNSATGESSDVSRSLFSSHYFARHALNTCRALWAQFNILLMSLGLVVQLVSLVTSVIIYNRLGDVSDWEKWMGKRIGRMIWQTLAVAILGPVIHTLFRLQLLGVSLLDTSLFIVSLASCGSLLQHVIPTLSFQVSSFFRTFPLLLVLHTAGFVSNSFTFWEDRNTLVLLLTSLASPMLAGITAPTNRLRVRILGYSALFALCVRLMAFSSICREEQQPYCHVTFYASSTVASSPLIILIAAVPTSLALPYVFRKFLAISGSDKGLAPVFLSYVFRPALTVNTVCWLLEWAETTEMSGGQWGPTLRTARTVLARCAIGGTLFGAAILWWFGPLCVEVEIRDKQDDGKSQEKTRQVLVLGASNAYGSNYLLFWCILFTLVHLTSQLTAQVVLTIAAIALLSYIEMTDSVRDVEALNQTFSNGGPSAALDLQSGKVPQAPFSFHQLSTLSLLAIHTFYTTGHQSTLQSLQWKAAFLLTSTLTYPYSPLLVVLNTCGPYIVLAAAAPLLACWQFPPLPQPSSRHRMLGGSVRAALGTMIYFQTLLIGSAVCSAWLRRHLMVWKVFAPRFMYAAAGLTTVDAALLLSLGFGIFRTSKRVSHLFEKMN